MVCLGFEPGAAEWKVQLIQLVNRTLEVSLYSWSPV